MLPMALGAMWWANFGEVALLILAISCWFRWIGIREIQRGFYLGGLHEVAWIRLWYFTNCINAGAGVAVTLGVLVINHSALTQQSGSILLEMIQNIWIWCLVCELLITTRVISAVATWLESTWVKVTQAVVTFIILLTVVLHIALLMAPTSSSQVGVAIVVRAGAILAAAALGVIAIWWIADGVNRMALALADEVSEETPSTL